MAASREHALRVRIASEHRRRDPDPDLIAELQRERAVVRIQDYVRGILAAAPPLTAGQRRELAALLLDEGGASAAA
jgi:hypothetical protein